MELVVARRFNIDNLRPWEWWAWEADEAAMTTAVTNAYTETMRDWRTHFEHVAQQEGQQ